ncbi:protein of unknown function DUF1552 [Chthoniobacter flavus Ellin428]|uniref:DUF1552 domain-containing protein n=1 Tax=Chthoniobacter flavus Ellin428 TaxID=497964 RepID=B4D8E3_9BACT|nr:DUF1552 domain-containing protein [Chthoniobacter flavus]EDY17336.1 protein of unknown function DUF1552 [Chthoniobacter flavus Ellin428]TCO90095.1 uncharacterized protein DUF1552 [Chthoniobacter flavus]
MTPPLLSPGLVNRRHFLRNVGACLALPFLESLARGRNAPPQIQRLVCVANPFGMIHDAFFPTEVGLATTLPENLQSLDGLRGKFTVFSNLDHGFGGGHGATHAFLSGVRSSEAASMPNGNITLDQFCGERCAGQTRFPVLNTSAGSNDGGGVELSWTRSGVMVPSIQKVTRVFEMLFVDDPAAQAGERAARYDEQGSILDAVNEQAKAMNRRLSTRDQEKLDQYFTSVRQVEKSLQDEKAWLSRPRPKVDMKEPRNGTVTQQVPILFELIALALQTDSTRVATLEVPGAFDCAGVGLTEKSYHGYSHHGKDPTLMAGLRKVERYQIEHLAQFVKKLGELELLDSTQILFGSGMSDGSAHTNKNLPVILAGGGYAHQTHLAMPGETGKKVPLCNLYLTMAQRFGIETASFGTSKGTINGLT